MIRARIRTAVDRSGEGGRWRMQRIPSLQVKTHTVLRPNDVVVRVIPPFDHGSRQPTSRSPPSVLGWGRRAPRNQPASPSSLRWSTRDAAESCLRRVQNRAARRELRQLAPRSQGAMMVWWRLRMSTRIERILSSWNLPLDVLRRRRSTQASCF